MIVIVCVEDDMGILFNRRRVSRDRMVYQDILQRCEQKLWISQYTASLFPADDRICIDDQCLQKAQEGQWCFVEGLPLQPVQQQIEELILYRWNRSYPSDVRLDLDLTDWQLMDSQEFAGHSHEKITREHYRRRPL